MVAIYALGGISGANFNPAVSFALAMTSQIGHITCEFPWGQFFAYSSVQFVAGVGAALLYTALFAETFDLSPGAGFGLINACLCELLYTFMLCFVVLNVAASKAAKEAMDSEPGGNQFYGLAIGFVIVAGAYGAGPVSGGCFNPALALGIDFASVQLGFGWCLPYIVCETVGATLAVAMFRLCRPDDFGVRERTLIPRVMAEFLGTFMLVLTVGLNVMAASPAAAFSIAASLMCMIYALGDVSGAHFNPAVTVAVMAVNRIDWKRACWYIFGQLLGGFLAAATYVLIWAGKAFPLAPDPHWIPIAVAETIFTAVLVFVVLCVAFAEREDTSKCFGLAIGSCVTVGGLAIGKISGGSLNPAVSFGIAMGASLGGAGNESWVKAFCYTTFEVAGAALASGLFAATFGVTPVSPTPKRSRSKLSDVSSALA
jgi:aquaporin Z